MRHHEYWKEYRRQHPEYTERNRRAQRDRDCQRRGTARSKATRVLANEDVSTSLLSLKSGIYELKPVMPAGAPVLANEDVWRVQIAVLPGS